MYVNTYRSIYQTHAFDIPSVSMQMILYENRTHVYGDKMPKPKYDIVIANANELVTLAGPKRGRVRDELSELSIVRNGALAISGGKVKFAGKTENLDGSGKVEIDASGKTVIPGLVDPHTHLIFGGSREFELDMKLKGMSYMEIMKHGGGIHSTVRATRSASFEELSDQAMRTLDVMLSYGTTTVEGKSGYGLNKEDELKSLEVLAALSKSHSCTIVPTFLGAHAVPLEYKDVPDKYIKLLIDEIIPEVGARKLAKFCDVFAEKGVYSIEDARRILVAGKQHGMVPKIHADEIVPLGGAELAAELGAISADHLLMSSDRGFEAMAKAGVTGVLLPGTPYTLMQKEYANARKMISLGIAVALATDYNPNCYTESMQLMISYACFNMRMTPSEALAASTINAAYAIGLGDSVGSLEPGKAGDAVVLDVPNHLWIPYHFGVNHVLATIKAGKVVFERMPNRKSK